MVGLGRFGFAVAAVILPLALAACGERQPKPDNAAIDRHLNQMIVDEEAERRRLIEEARDREEVREREMEQREANYSNSSD